MQEEAPKEDDGEEKIEEVKDEEETKEKKKKKVLPIVFVCMSFDTVVLGFVVLGFGLFAAMPAFATESMQVH